MRMGNRKIRGGLYLALILALVLAVGANALNVVNTHATSGSLSKDITVTSAGTYKHDALAPANGNLHSEIDGVGALPVDEIDVSGGNCTSHTVGLQVTDDRNFYALMSSATITSGTAKAQVRSQEIVSICPNGNGN
ncbi:MAG: hypothetical protein IPG71_02080 [bacterium]|nr:hypothetical protein [bacterium]